MQLIHLVKGTMVNDVSGSFIEHCVGAGFE